MAVQEWELVPQESRTVRPVLRLVEPPRTPRRAAAAATFVLLLAATLGYPVTRAALDQPAPPATPVPRPQAAAQIASLDPLSPMTKPSRPRSSEPVGGIVFVRCTRLWTALPDGSHQRKIVEMPGIYSPAFAPNARTIGFLVAGESGDEMWLAAADGSGIAKVGDITSGGWPLDARATSLGWSKDGRYLSFALVSPHESIWTGGSSVWTLELTTGKFAPVGSGVAPFWVGNRLGFAEWRDGDGPDLSAVGRLGRELGGRTSSDLDDVAAAIVPDGYGTTAVVRRTPRGEAIVAVKRARYNRGERFVVHAPPGYRITDDARVAIAEDGSRVWVDLVDRSGEMDLGLLDARSGEWTVLDYAWSATTSPAPTAMKVRARRAVDVTNELLGSFNRKHGTKTMLLMGKRPDDDLLPMRRLRGYTVGTPEKQGTTWIVPASVWGRTEDGSAYRHLEVRVRAERGRIVASPHALSDIHPLVTIQDAAAFLADALDTEIPLPAWLPEGVRLQPDYSVSAWSWNGRATGSIYLVLGEAGGDRNMTLYYGDDVGFNMGCGATNDPRATEVAGVPAMIDHLDDATQVIWPAAPKALGAARFSVYGWRVPDEVVMRVAASMEAARQ